MKRKNGVAALAEKKEVLSMEDEDRAFFISAYRTNPEAREDMDAAMKETGVSYEEFFGLDGKDKKTGPHGEEKCRAARGALTGCVPYPENASARKREDRKASGSAGGFFPARRSPPTGAPHGMPVQTLSCY